MKTTFKLRYDSRWGEELYLTGNSAELGLWNPNKAVKMEYEGPGIWSVETDVMPTTEYKYFIRENNQIRWEDGPNRILPEGKDRIWDWFGLTERQTLQGVAVPLVSLRTDPSKNAITLFLGEVLYRAVRDGMAEEGLYDWCERSILTLEALEKDYANFHLRWLLELAAAMGFEPSAEDLSPFAGELFQDVKALLDASFEEAMLLPLSGERRSELCEVFIRYLSHHSESTLDIRSLRVLRELF